MINDFSRSTSQEILYQSKLKMETRESFLKSFKSTASKLTLKTVWNAGYSAGWRLFQMRKLKSPFRKPIFLEVKSGN
jgi:hypothetical protein